MIEAMKRDLEVRFADVKKPEGMHLAAAYAGNREEAEQWKKELEEVFSGYHIHMDPLSLSVSCHIGPGALAVTCSKVVSVK